MDWNALGAVGELVGALAVVLTLGYLALQMKQNAIGMKIAAKQEMTRQYSDYVDLLLLNPDLRDINEKGLSAEGLIETDRPVFRLLMSKVIWYFASMHYQYTQHGLSDDEWIQSKELISQYCSRPGFRWFWENRKHHYSIIFREYIESHWDESGT